MSIQTILSKLHKVKNRGDGKWMACCPVHHEKTPSLSIKDNNGNILIHCFGCGASGVDVCNAIGEDVSELFPETGYSNYSPGDYERSAKHRSYFPADQILEALQTETLVVYMIAKDILENGITEPVKERLLQSVSRIQAVNLRYR